MARSTPHPTHTNRRRWLAATARLTLSAGAIGLLTATSGCGFKLRHGYSMAFKTIQLTGFAGNSPLAAELARALEVSGVDVVDSTLAATTAASASSVPISHIVLDGIADRRDMTAATTTAYGQIRDMTVTTVVRFQVKRGDGSVLLPPADVALNSSMTYNEKDALSKQDETESLHRAMQSDIVNQILRRLAAIRADQLATPPEPAAPGVVNAASAPASPPLSAPASTPAANASSPL